MPENRRGECKNYLHPSFHDQLHDCIGWTKGLRMRCPLCKGEDISENNVLYVRLRVTDWCDDEEPGDFQYPWTEVPDTIRTVADEAPRWYCHDCGEDVRELEKVEEEEPCT